IIRLADWFGIRHIICSYDCADVFNPKVVQATMGALAHVQVHYTNPEEYLEQQIANLTPIYGTFLDGDDLYNDELTNHGILIMGSEGKGIRSSVEEFVNKRLYIPSYPANQATSESLNVAVATAIVCAEFRRRSIQAG
ncbi:RNA methyltransferase, partial [Parabacteroides sp. OttesenSCG-928-G07]|nr:RNA methyltransferase [Parabacteroides sp. OttesenSCG-928-G07]